MTLEEDGPECDFCNLAVDEGETLQPIYVGELPQPKPHRLTKVGKSGSCVGDPELRGTKMGAHLLGKPIGTYVAMYQALENCPDIDIDVSNVVEGVGVVGGGSIMVKEDEPVRTRHKDDKVGVSLKIRPKDVTYTPDAEVCDTCAEMFESLGQ